LTLIFPNNSRHYDAGSGRIKFSGYDGVFEIRFQLELDALAKAYAGTLAGEREYLSAFDSVKKRIIVVAERSYRKQRGQSICMLTADDFR
jgi:hypothetical protein